MKYLSVAAFLSFDISTDTAFGLGLTGAQTAGAALPARHKIESQCLCGGFVI
jgi:hypothetical protein